MGNFDPHNTETVYRTKNYRDRTFYLWTDISSACHPTAWNFAFLVAIPLGVSKYGLEKGLRVDHFLPLKHQFLPFDREYLEKGRSQRHRSIRTWYQLDGSFL